jgi:hypothetical protein
MALFPGITTAPMSCNNWFKLRMVRNPPMGPGEVAMTDITLPLKPSYMSPSPRVAQVMAFNSNGLVKPLYSGVAMKMPSSKNENKFNTSYEYYNKNKRSKNKRTVVSILHVLDATNWALRDLAPCGKALFSSSGLNRGRFRAARSIEVTIAPLFSKQEMA